jgi:hypothetical protein
MHLSLQINYMFATAEIRTLKPKHMQACSLLYVKALAHADMFLCS